MIGSSQDNFGSKRTKRLDNFRIIRSDNHPIDVFALFNLIDHVLNERFSGSRCENFLGESSRGEAGGDDGYDFQNGTSIRNFTDRYRRLNLQKYFCKANRSFVTI